MLKALSINVRFRNKLINMTFGWFLGSLIRPKVTRSVHFCPTTKKFMERRYADMTSLEAFPTSSVYPTKV